MTGHGAHTGLGRGLLRGGLAGQHSWQRRVRQLQDDADWERQKAVLLALLPYAVPRLPAADLACFDGEQRPIRRLPRRPEPHPTWRSRLPHLFTDGPTMPLIPAQRRPHPSEVRHGR